MEKRVQIIAALVDGTSIRATERMVDANRQTIMFLGVEVGEGCAALLDRMVRGLNCSRLELDEIWSFVRKKQAQLTETDSEEYGDQYTWVAFDPQTRLVVSWRTDKRTSEVANLFLKDLRQRVLNRPHITTDSLITYIDAIDQAFGVDVDYAQVKKQCEGATLEPGQPRFVPGAVYGVTKRAVVGQPNLRVSTTNHVERQNLTMRMSMRRFTRQCNGFSKKLRNLRAAVALHFAHYNLCRVHEAIRVTPAMEAGLTDHVWSIEELIVAALIAPPAPNQVPGEPHPMALEAPTGAARRTGGGTVLRLIPGGANGG